MIELITGELVGIIIQGFVGGVTIGVIVFGANYAGATAWDFFKNI